MSLTLIGRSSLPATRRGATGTMSVRVADNGQIGFSTSAGKVFGNFTACKIDFDPDSRKMIFTPVNTSKLPKGLKEEDTFKVGQSKDGSNRYISAAGLFKLPVVAYDYSVGSYSFDAIQEGNSLSFVLPQEMAKKEVTPRKPRAAKTVAAAAGTAGAGSAVDEPELQTA